MTRFIAYVVPVCLLLTTLSGCVTPGAVVKVSPPDAYRGGYPNANIIRPSASAPEHYSVDGTEKSVPDSGASGLLSAFKRGNSRGADKDDIASCKGKQLSCVYDYEAVGLGTARVSSGSTLRRAFKAPLPVPGRYRVDTKAGAVSFGGGTQHTSSRIFTVYYNDATGIISDIVF